MHKSALALSPHKQTKFIIFSTLAISLFLSTDVFAVPVLDQVANGTVDFTQTAGETNALQINQQSDQAILNWSSFNVAAEEGVHFQQPTNGVCLNRIDALNGMSQIDGSLTATGKIFLINQAGVLFGDNAQVNVGGIVTSTIDIADQNFLDGNFVFDQPSNVSSAIINHGLISANDNGFVDLLAANVASDGIIQAKAGKLVLASGDKFTVDFYGDGVINFATVDLPAKGSGLNEYGVPLSSGVDVAGEIISDMGDVLLTASATQGVFDNLINMSGVVRARTVDERAGYVVLNGTGPGIVKVTGAIDVSGINADSDGGGIGILGEKLVLDDYANLNASGDPAWGLIIVGGNSDVLDTTTEFTSTKSVYVGPDVIITADAQVDGDGGTILVWSEGDTNFLGTASAQGGAKYGDGGLVYVVGSQSTETLSTQINVSAPNGYTGDIGFELN